MTDSATNSSTIPSTNIGSWRVYPSPRNIPAHTTVITRTRPTTLEPENPTPYA
ncbi:hypothetical protein GZ205_03175, partial [Dermatophilus congolensis]|nr:hypothetical protein [Dermatophilus congolensis]